VIAFVKGVLEIKSNGFIIVDVAGIGYKIFMSESSIEKIGKAGDKVIVYTYHQVKEDEQNLYGFIEIEELNMFELLISVSGVGAKSALNILANIDPSEFAIAVVSNDTSSLVKIPGLGAKTAARIILELKDKLKDKEIKAVKNIENDIAVKQNETLDEAVSALQVLGYNKKDIENVFEKIDTKDLKLEEIIKLGLKYLSRK